MPLGVVWLHRDLPDEMPVPFELGIVHRDDDLLVVDKPHFMATIPRGRHILQTALVRLRTELGLPELSAAHRLDRVTAGLVMFVVRRERRGAYQTLFRDRLVHKEYRADRAVPGGPRAAAHGAQPDRQGARRHHGVRQWTDRRTRRPGSNCSTTATASATTGCCPRPGAPTSCGCT